ncbi:RHS repeat-associated core domain-containing protein [Herpetosiphon llansteffanensis]|uniref:RHS repeat-associated core domain-containing protein n=1 Tax=Herpetosiphon llansteffanensis TaxID=2094568 RepID=UPI000D7CBA66|nr:RHS repeat-associated core domain-containing protein [Herpetosiphon llansteffanensis]
MPSSRPSRMLAMLLLTSVLTSLLPHAAAAAPTTLTPTARAIPAVPTVLDEPPPGHRPAAATSILTPEEYAEIVNRAIEETHQAQFDGTFSGGIQHEVFTHNTLYEVTSQQDPQLETSTALPIIIPAYAHDSFKVDLAFKASTIGPYFDAARAVVFVKPVGSSTWMPASTIAEQFDPISTDPTPTTTFHVTFTGVNRLPADQPIEMRIACNSFFSTAGWCRFSNFRFYDDAPGWTRYESESETDSWSSTTWTERIGVVNDSSTSDGPFFLVDIPSGTRTGIGPGNGITYRGGRMRMPPLQSGDTLQGTLRWAEDSRQPVAPVLPRGEIRIEFLPDSPPGAQPVTLAMVPGRPNTTPSSLWHQGDLLTIPVADVANKTGTFAIHIETGARSPAFVGIDSFKLYLNGQELIWSNTHNDQSYNCKCSKTAAGGYQLVIGDPVNTLSGVLIESAIDATIATASTPLSMQRTYVSGLADPATVPQSPLGFGWRFNYGETLTLPSASVGAEPNTIIYESAEGNRYRFRDYGGVYSAAPGIRASLSAVSGGYRITFPDQSWREFDSAGRLVKLADSAGRTQTISLSMSGSTKDYPLAVTDDFSGRTLDFSYTTVSGVGLRLQTVTDDLNQVTTYGYDTAGHLTWVTSPQGTITRYETNSLHQIIGIAKGLTSYDTTASRRDLVMTYTAGKVTQQVERDGRTWQYAYATTPTGEPQTTITIRRNGVILDTQIAHYRSDRTLRWVEHNNTFSGYQTNDIQFAAAAQANPNGTTVRSTANAVGLTTRIEAGSIGSSNQHSLSGIATTISYGSNNQPETVTAPGNIVTTTQYNAANQPISVQLGNMSATTMTYLAGSKLPETVTSPDGVVTKYSYTALGQVSLVEVGYGTNTVQKTAYSYDVLGRLTDVTIGYDTSLATTTHSDYRADNQVWKVTQNYKNGGTPSTATQNVVTEYGYDSYGRVIWTKGPDGRYRDVTSYDSAGRVRWIVDNALTGSGVPTIPTLTGNPPAFSPSYPSGNVATLFGYDWLGRTTLVTQTGILTGTFNPSTLLWSSSTTRVTRTEYDALSRPVTTTLNYRADINGGQFSPQYTDVNVQTYTYYDGAGNVTWTRDALRRWTRFEYDALSRPVTTTLNYENGNPLTIDSANSSWASLSDTDIVQVTRYDSAGRADRTIDNYVNGVQATFAPNPTLPWQISDVITDRMTLTTFDNLGRATQTTNNSVTANPGALAELNQTTGTIYAPNGRVVATYDVTGQFTVPIYDTLGRVTKSVENCRNASGVKVSSFCSTQTSDRNVLSAQVTYDALGRAFDVIETSNTRTRTFYDGLGRVTSVIQNEQPGVAPTSTINVTTLTSYADAAGITVTTTDPTGKATTTTRNLDTGVTSTTAPSGLITRTGPRWSKTPDGQISVSMIDGLGRTIQSVSNYQDGLITGADGTTRDLISRTNYDVAGRTVASSDTVGIITHYRYDLRDNLIQVIENADGPCSQVEASDCQVTTNYRYDRAGNQTAVINGKGITSRVLRYDARDQLRNQEDALRNGTSTTYTVRGAVASVQPTGATAITTGYDELGRPISKTGAAGASQSWTYDSAGRMATAFDASAQNTATGKTGVLTYNYDALNRVSGIQQSLADDPNATWTLGYTYDAAGRVTLIGGNSYGYDSAGRLQTVGRGGFTIAQYGYNSTTGWAETLTRSEAGTSRAVETTLYDTLGRVSSITVNGATGSGTTPTAQLTQFGYTYDRASRRVTFSEVQLNGSGTTVTENHSYGYDNLGRLASETAGSTTTGYGYDRAGNRVRVGSTNLDYQNNDRRTGWSYDASGNVLNNGTQSYTYDGFNRPTTVTIGANSYSYRYHDESLVSKSTNGTLTNAFVTDRVGTSYSNLLRISTFVGSDQYDTTYVTGLGGIVLHSDQVKNGTPVVNGKNFMVSDAQRTMRMTINSANGARGKQDSDAWGQAVGAPISSIRYTGEFSDAQTGLVFLRARWYNPANGSFLSVDPFAGKLLEPQSLHSYTYVHNDPINKVDPSGLFYCTIARAFESLAYNKYCQEKSDKLDKDAAFNALLITDTLGALIYLYTLEDLPGGSKVPQHIRDYQPRITVAEERTDFVLWYISNDRSSEFHAKFDRVKFNDTGLAAEFRDSHYGGFTGSNQINHFMSGVHATLLLPDGIAKECMIGHEILGQASKWDQCIAEVNSHQMDLFDRAIEADRAGSYSERDCYLNGISDVIPNIPFNFAGLTPATGGRSMQDLRLSLKSYIFADKLYDEELRSLADVRTWLRNNLR